MSCLCDNEIELLGCCGVMVPFLQENVQPASYELTFDGKQIFEARRTSNAVYDIEERCFIDKDTYEPLDPDRVWHRFGSDERFWFDLQPGELYIGSSIERLTIPENVMARFEGKSTLGRAGLMVHMTAGYIDPGFEGNLTLEMMNMAPWPIRLRHGDKIGQLSFHDMSRVPQHTYGECGNHYQGQDGATTPR